MADRAAVGRSAWSARAWLAVWVLLTVAALPACETTGPGEPSEPGSSLVCPGCKPGAGGETTDFGASGTECHSVTKIVDIERARAVELGFDVDALRERMERPIDAELDWEVDLNGSSSGYEGKPATGYENPTHVTVSVSVNERLGYYRPDPEHCSDGVCTVPESSNPPITVIEATCPTFLMLYYDMEISTADGAIQASGSGEAARWSEGFDDMIGAGTAKELHGHAYVDLAEVRGTLQLDPDTDLPYGGELVVVLDFEDGATHGHVWPRIAYDVVDDHGDDMLVIYKPLQGRW